MLKIVARLTVKKENIDEFKRTAADLIHKSNAEEGNVFYTLNQNVDDEEKFAFIECWKDNDAIKTHGASKHFTETFPLLQKLAESAEPVEVYNELSF